MQRAGAALSNTATGRHLAALPALNTGGDTTGRPTKDGLDYFRHDIGLMSDPKLITARRKYGAAAIVVYLQLLVMAYRDKGYYLAYGDSDRDGVIWSIKSEVLSGRYEPDAEKIAENGWSRNVLVHQIESRLYQRRVLAEKVSNFESRLPSPQSELAVQTMKDPYIFDFIPFKEDMIERDIEQALVKDVTKLLLELGTGFAFLGNQYHLNVGGDDFYIDLLFYNLNLCCYVVVELKTGEFKPEYAGQLNFYLSAVDGILKKEQDNPSIGLLLCKSKNDLVAEYSLKDVSKPIGVSAYQITSNLPEELECQLPSVEDIQKRIRNQSV